MGLGYGVQKGISRDVATDLPEDVPSPIDLRTMADAQAWARLAMEKRPWREEFFDVIIQEIQAHHIGNPSVLELGSGPGFFARRILEAMPSARYSALDFSSAMHTLAKERLGPLSARMQFIQANFKEQHWSANLPRFDAVVAIQSVHEVRHKRHAPSLYRAIRELLQSEGVFWMCDHILGENGMNNCDLYMTAQEHELALSAGGFSSIRMLLEKHGLILFRAATGGHA